MAYPAWSYNPNWVYKKLYSGLDPVQGDSKDCYLIAALSSLAWTCRMNIAGPNPAGNVIMRFWDITANPPAWSGSFTAQSSEVLPVDAAGNLCCARSGNGPNETWPAIYEKLYARFLNIGADPNSPGNPDICNRMPDPSNPLTTLVALTGWTSNSDAPANYARIFSDLTAPMLDPKQENGKKTRYPVVAWTVSPSIQPGTAICPRHSYSLLGTYSEAGTDYIVLRNPLGPIAANPGITLKTMGSWTVRDRCYRRNSTEYTAIYPATGAPLMPLSFDLSRGIFAIKASEFPGYFDGFGWIS